MARGHNPLSDPRCLRRASGKPLLPSGLRSVLQYLCKQGACMEIQYRRALTGTLEVRMVRGSFSGVKDARKSVLIADASASAHILHYDCGNAAEVLHFDCMRERRP